MQTYQVSMVQSRKSQTKYWWNNNFEENVNIFVCKNVSFTVYHDMCVISLIYSIPRYVCD